MDHKTYNWITSLLVFGIWLYLGFGATRAYLQVIRAKRGVNADDQEIKEALNKWKSTVRKLGLFWVVTAIFFLLLSMIIDRTIGFKNKYLTYGPCAGQQAGS